MPYTAPTAATIKARFSEFADVDDALIDQLIAEAGQFVGTNWPETIYTSAQTFWVAHELVMAGQGTSQQAQISQVSGGGVSRIKSGDLDVSFAARPQASAGSAADAAYYGQSSYGQRFLAYRTQAFPGIGII